MTKMDVSSPIDSLFQTISFLFVEMSQIKPRRFMKRIKTWITIVIRCSFLCLRDWFTFNERIVVRSSRSWVRVRFGSSLARDWSRFGFTWFKSLAWNFQRGSFILSFTCKKYLLESHDIVLINSSSTPKIRIFLFSENLFMSNKTSKPIPLSM